MSVIIATDHISYNHKAGRCYCCCCCWWWWWWLWWWWWWWWCWWWWWWWGWCCCCCWCWRYDQPIMTKLLLYLLLGMILQALRKASWPQPGVPDGQRDSSLAGPGTVAQQPWQGCKEPFPCSSCSLCWIFWRFIENMETNTVITYIISVFTIVIY